MPNVLLNLLQSYFLCRHTCVQNQFFLNLQFLLKKMQKGFNSSFSRLHTFRPGDDDQAFRFYRKLHFTCSVFVFLCDIVLALLKYIYTPKKMACSACLPKNATFRKKEKIADFFRICANKGRSSLRAFYYTKLKRAIIILQKTQMH